MATKKKTTTTGTTTKPTAGTALGTGYTVGTYTQDQDVTDAQKAAKAHQNYSEDARATNAYNQAQKYQNYNQSGKVNNLWNAYTDITEPGDYSSAYAKQIANTTKAIENRGEFSYDMNADALYQQYKNQYLQQGNLAMQDTLGQATALTGGYNNSYAQSAAQQTYQGYLGQLNDVIPELEQLAYEKYQDEGTDLYNKLSMYQNLDSTDYDRYRDTVSDYYNDKQMAYDVYNTEATRDYSQFSDNRSYWTDLYNTETDRAYNRFATDRDYYQNVYDTLADRSWNQYVDQEAINLDAYAQNQSDAQWYANWLASQEESASSGSGGSGGNTTTTIKSDSEYTTDHDKNTKEHVTSSKGTGEANQFYGETVDGEHHYSEVKSDIEDMSYTDGMNYLKKLWGEGHLTTAEYSSLVNVLRGGGR